MIIETLEKENCKGFLLVDEDPPNPRRDYDPLATFVCDHKSYDLGDTNLKKLTGYDVPGFLGTEAHVMDSIESHIRKHHGAVVFVWLGLLDHSGLHIYEGGGASPFDPGGWDSGTIGFAFVSRETVIYEYGEDTAETRETALSALRGEIETYDMYMRGDVYGYQVVDDDEEVVDSLWGIYGYQNALKELEEALGE